VDHHTAVAAVKVAVAAAKEVVVGMLVVEVKVEVKVVSLAAMGRARLATHPAVEEGIMPHHGKH